MPVDEGDETITAVGYNTSEIHYDGSMTLVLFQPGENNQMKRILVISIFLALLASCDTSVKEEPRDIASEIEALMEAEWGERRAVLITAVPDVSSTL